MTQFFVGDRTAGSRVQAKESAISLIGDGCKNFKQANMKLGTPKPKVKRNERKKGYEVILKQ